MRQFFFQAEVFAILTCAYRNLERGYKSNILILLDSQSAIKALESYQVSSKLKWECLHTLQTLATDNNVGFQGIEELMVMCGISIQI